MSGMSPRPASQPRAAPGIAARAALGLLWLYKRTLSPAFYALGARCRYAPSCSEYAAEAIRRHGAFRGAVAAAARLSRCHPLGGSGWDPAPARLPDAGWRIWRYGDWAWTARAVPDAPDQSSTRAKDSENPPGAPSSTRPTSG
ncbi:membrane protein insertion efficiency factor YidD [Amphiplicatus metriothermophilus]|uniref:Putative membrane protein insertion efficiency factor n=1 Tax=Amphiplicatus metriothermophilus TaxID=1519374 RepID=A0A239PJB2_9PROT|nr:membrane protein insertion efficiency factor YidD [Amphiplicatus metriothermophilus]MBB5517775.1 hypothetical protein [Amphiplicatus metriothermophilus]SNT67891.1 hypothetical protein SAMN06297382_0384 [Amphiplicatus metriothermophilus]